MRNKMRLRQRYQTVAVVLTAMFLLSVNVSTKADGPDRVVSSGPLSCCTVGPSCTVVVPGKSNPWLAGAPPATTTPDGDSAPAQSPVLVSCLAFAPGDRLTFTAFGNVSNCPSGCPISGPDGDGVISHLYGEEFFIPDITAPLNSLVGIFLGPGPPVPPTPSPSDFSTFALQNYGNLSPLRGQVFFIGDGRGSLGPIEFCQGVFVPPGATQLFLGTMDGFDWKNNINNFAVTICKQNSFCLQDDTNGNILRFNTATGHYLFIRCSDGFTLTGKGFVTVSGCTISLHDFPFLPEPPPPPFGPPLGLNASVNTCSMNGTASLTVTTRRLVRVFTINDTNTADNTCRCQGAGLPDLVPEPLLLDPARVSFCRLDPSGRLVIRVKNQGTAASLPTFTRVEFLPGEVVFLRTPKIPPSEAVDLLPPLVFPGACYNPDCDFRITVDWVEFVDESDESNNTVDGRCIGG